jgi:hypothetical protein
MSRINKLRFMSLDPSHYNYPKYREVLLECHHSSERFYIVTKAYENQICSTKYFTGRLKPNLQSSKMIAESR